MSIQIFETLCRANATDSSRASCGFGQAKYVYGGSVLGASQFTLLPQLSLKMTLDLKMVKITSKIIISLFLNLNL